MFFLGGRHCESRGPAAATTRGDGDKGQGAGDCARRCDEIALDARSSELPQRCFLQLFRRSACWLTKRGVESLGLGRDVEVVRQEDQSLRFQISDQTGRGHMMFSPLVLSLDGPCSDNWLLV
jgi:hypothetical protein